MGLISPGGENLLYFLELAQVLSTYDGDFRDPLCGLRKGQSPSNSHGDWPFLRPPERVLEVPDISREQLPYLEKIQEVLPSRRDEAHFC